MHLVFYSIPFQCVMITLTQWVKVPEHQRRSRPGDGHLNLRNPCLRLQSPEQFRQFVGLFPDHPQAPGAAARAGAQLLICRSRRLASASPDGLNRVAEEMGFLYLGQSAPYQILPGYTIPFLGQTALSTIVAGAVGALVVLGLMVVVGSILRRKKVQQHE